MDSHRTLRLLPLGERIDVALGTPLQDVLFLHGVEFPCGGHGRCRGCRVRVLEGDLPVTPAMRHKLSDAELAAGWRLSCCASVEGPLALEVAQWTTPGLVTTLADTLEVPFEPGEGLGVAVDLGTLSDIILLSARDHKLISNVVHVHGEAKAAEAYDKGEVVAFYGESALVENLAHQTGKPVSIVYPPHRLAQSWPLGGAVRADSIELADAIDKEIARMAESGELKKIFASYGVAWRQPTQEK